MKIPLASFVTLSEAKGLVLRMTDHLFAKNEILPFSFAQSRLASLLRMTDCRQLIGNVSLWP